LVIWRICNAVLILMTGYLAYLQCSAGFDDWLSGVSVMQCWFWWLVIWRICNAVLILMIGYLEYL